MQRPGEKCGLREDISLVFAIVVQHRQKKLFQAVAFIAHADDLDIAPGKS
jgi:hypothetical protein